MREAGGDDQEKPDAGGRPGRGEKTCRLGFGVLFVFGWVFWEGRVVGVVCVGWVGICALAVLLVLLFEAATVG